jgi:hypothetical protein
VRREALRHPVGELPHVGGRLAVAAGRQLVVAQVVRDVTGSDDQEALCRERRQRAAEGVCLLRAAVALDGERDDRYVGVREHQAQRHPRAVVEAAFAIGCDGQARCPDGGDDLLGRRAAAGGRIAQGVEGFGKTVEIVDGFQAIGKPDRRHPGIPVGADDDDGARQGQGAGYLAEGCTGRTRPQCEGRCAVRYEKCGLSPRHCGSS